MIPAIFRILEIKRNERDAEKQMISVAKALGVFFLIVGLIILILMLTGLAKIKI